MGNVGTKFGLTFMADYGSWELPEGHRVLRYILIEDRLTKHDQDFHSLPGAVDEFSPGDCIEFAHLYVRDRSFEVADQVEIESAIASFRRASDQSEDCPFTSGVCKIYLDASAVILKDPYWGSGFFGDSDNPCYFFGCIGYRGYNDNGSYREWPSEPPFPWTFKDNDTGEAIEYEFSFELRLKHTPAGSDVSTTSVFKFDPKWVLTCGSGCTGGGGDG